MDIYTILAIYLFVIALYFNDKRKIFEFTKSESKYPIDFWFIAHFNSGLLYYLVTKNMNFKNKEFWGVMIAIIFEFFENSHYGIKTFSRHSLRYYGDSISNAVVDIVAFIMAYKLSKIIGMKYVKYLIGICIFTLFYFESDYILSLVKG